jgi:hypothetical protein
MYLALSCQLTAMALQEDMVGRQEAFFHNLLFFPRSEPLPGLVDMERREVNQQRVMNELDIPVAVPRPEQVHNARTRFLNEVSEVSQHKHATLL